MPMEAQADCLAHMSPEQVKDCFTRVLDELDNHRCLRALNPSLWFKLGLSYLSTAFTARCCWLRKYTVRNHYIWLLWVLAACPLPIKDSHSTVDQTACAGKPQSNSTVLMWPSTTKFW